MNANHRDHLATADADDHGGLGGRGLYYGRIRMVVVHFYDTGPDQTDTV